MDLTGKTVTDAGIEMLTALKLLASFSQYSSAADVALLVSQQSVMSSSISSRVRIRSGSPPLCPTSCRTDLALPANGVKNRYDQHERAHHKSG